MMRNLVRAGVPELVTMSMTGHMDMPSQPFRVPGGLERPYPDYWNYTLRDYGNRVGVFRVMQLLDDLGLEVSVPLNSALAERHPFLVEQINKRGWEIIAHGVDMGQLHHGDLPQDQEANLVRQAVQTLRQASGQAVKGWLSPAKSESMHTPDLVAAQGIEYLCDWVNDDLPYAFRTASGTMYAMPHPYEIDDRLLLIGFRHSELKFLRPFGHPLRPVAEGCAPLPPSLAWRRPGRGVITFCAVSKHSNDREIRHVRDTSRHHDGCGDHPTWRP